MSGRRQGGRQRRRGGRDIMNFPPPPGYEGVEHGNAHGYIWLPPNRPRRRPSLLLVIVTVISLSLLGILAFLLLRPPSGFPYNSSDLYGQFEGASLECSIAPAVPKDRRKDKSLLKVVNFNAEWLFLYGGRGSIRCPSDACPWATADEALDHFKRVANVLALLDADIVHLDEVEDCRVLRALLSLLPPNHGYRPYFITGRDHITGQNVALLTRIDPVADMLRTEKRTSYPISESTCRKQKSGTIGITKHYVVPLDIADGAGRMIPFLVAGLHLLARPGDAWRCAQREGQAVILRDMLRSLSVDSNRTLLIMGDFNDYDEKVPGLDGKKPISSVLTVLYGSSGAGHRLTNVASLIPLSERYSCWFDVNQNCRVDGKRERVMIDHILFDSYLTRAVTEARILHDHMPTCSNRTSDHWPVLLTFDLTKLVHH